MEGLLGATCEGEVRLRGGTLHGGIIMAAEGAVRPHRGPWVEPVLSHSGPKGRVQVAPRRTQVVSDGEVVRIARHALRPVGVTANHMPPIKAWHPLCLKRLQSLG